MTIKDIFSETSSAILSNKARSGLTILGIIIGIASVIAMLAVGSGASGSIQSSIQSLGSNLLIVMPGAQRGFGNAGVSSGRGSSQTLTMDDVKAIETTVTSIKAVAPEVTTRTQIVVKGANTNTTVDGTVSAYTEVKDLTIDEGTFITDQHNTRLAKVAVLGPTTRDDLFGAGAEAIGQTIRINNISFTVVGVAAAKGGSGFTNNDDRIYIPLSVAQAYLSGKNANGQSYVSDINIEAESQDVMTDIQNQVTALLMSRHGITDSASADFNIINQADIVSAASSVTSTLTFLLAAVASISLIVGGIGIMNMMLTTVTERTKEIGLRKAIGAKKKDISTQFLIEAILLTFTGGTIGIILGWAIAFAVSSLGILQATVSLSSVLLAFGVSTIIGIVFGYYPARRAANLSPIEALRYE